MSDLIIRRRLESPLFGTWKWQKEDYSKPLNFQLDGARSQILIEEDRYKKSHICIVMHLQFILIFQAAPQDYIAALKSRGEKSIQLAHRIYNYFLETITRLEKLLRITGKVRDLPRVGAPSIQGFYNCDGLLGSNVEWEVDGQSPKDFLPKLSKQNRGKNPLFKHPQLITTDKWKRFQTDIDSNNFPPEDILELNRLAGQVYPNNKRIPLIETAIMIEGKLKTYANKTLSAMGFTKGKIKDLDHDLSFNTVLNLLLPLTLSKSDIQLLKKCISLVDRIRKLRNDIVHNGLKDHAINENEVIDGIYAAIDLFNFLNKKSPP